MIELDPDNPELTDEQIKSARPFVDAFPDLAERITRSRGRPKSAPMSEVVSLRLSSEMIAKFKVTGPDWRLKMAKALEGRRCEHAKLG
ncbi:BrnA antitoxin family protein [Phreatobacter sp. AB_2022a]|uniref:BrnA antitoxin family protein n=1 Tax=Phreatobacter sp. AB_2022a TaxID=3003134 RepID=UPI0022875F69|nr:BrnA antitoxin family protein [Phreatobacter sp. AB_2022a]MCZ0734574.1 BrnA antitoxin family protein [Phreatobacter sp. AB_2022a]